MIVHTQYKLMNFFKSMKLVKITLNLSKELMILAIISKVKKNDIKSKKE